MHRGNFKRLKGVREVVSGYAGGSVEHPSYEQVCTGKTGHAEATQITFEPQIISYEKILEIFWAIHDPTTMNRQGNDVGTQYRSVIFYHNEDQRQVANKSKALLALSAKYKDPIVTEITPFTNFFKAEERHQEYYDRNKNYPYCRLVIDPKIKKLYKEFGAEALADTPSFS